MEPTVSGAGAASQEIFRALYGELNWFWVDSGVMEFSVFFEIFNDFSRFFPFKNPKKSKKSKNPPKIKQSSDDVTTIKTTKLAAYNITIIEGSKSMRRHFIAAAEARSLR